jgi:hypothetical protein
MENGSCEARHNPVPKRVVKLGRLIDVGNRVQWKGQVEKQEVNKGKSKRCSSQRMPVLLGLFIKNGFGHL